MFQFPRISPRKVWLPALVSLVPWVDTVSAQNFGMMVADPNPLRLGNFVPSTQDLSLGLAGGIKGEFTYGMGIQSIYNSNYFQDEENEQSEITTSFSPWLRYVSDPEGGAMVAVAAGYSPMFQTYLENPDLNTWNQNGNVTLSFQGAKTNISLFGNYSDFSGTDILTGTYTTGTVMTGGIQATRQLAPRTTLNASWSASKSDYSSGDSEGSQYFTTSVGGFWQATERLSFGPAISNTRSESDTTGTTDSWALLIQIHYRVGERIWLSAGVGPQYTMTTWHGIDTNSLGITGNLDARYVINERWTWTSAVSYATAPSSNQTNYLVNNLAITTALNRQLLRGSLSGGVALNYAMYENVGEDTTTTPDDQQNLSFFLGYNRNLFSERLGFNSQIRYVINSGQTDWTQLELILGLNYSF